MMNLPLKSCKEKQMLYMRALHKFKNASNVQILFVVRLISGALAAEQVCSKASVSPFR